MKALNAIMDQTPGLYESQFMDYNQSILNTTTALRDIKEGEEIIQTPRFDQEKIDLLTHQTHTKQELPNCSQTD